MFPVSGHVPNMLILHSSRVAGKNIKQNGACEINYMIENGGLGLYAAVYNCSNFSARVLGV